MWRYGSILTSTHAPFQCFDDWQHQRHKQAAVDDSDHIHTLAAADAAGDVHNHTLPAAEEDTANQTQTAEAGDDCIAQTDRDIDAVADADTDQGSPARDLVVQHQAGADSPDCSMVRT